MNTMIHSLKCLCLRGSLDETSDVVHALRPAAEVLKDFAVDAQRRGPEFVFMLTVRVLHRTWSGFEGSENHVVVRLKRFRRPLDCYAVVANGCEHNVFGVSEVISVLHHAAILRDHCCHKFFVLLQRRGCHFKSFGILTNGNEWRIYHRSSSSQQETFFQADMIGAMKSDFEDFKRFYLIFRKEAFVKTDGITCFLDSLLA